MSNTTNDTLLDAISDTIDWASELGEAWLGTTTGRILDSQRDELRSVVKSNDLELAEILVKNLAETCVFAQKELDERA